MKTSRSLIRAGLLVTSMILSSQNAMSQDKGPADPDAAASKFIADYETQVRPLEIAVNLAWWKANTTGKDEDFAAKVEAQNRYDEALADRQRFATLKALHDGKVKDPILAREVDVLYRTYLEKQVDPDLLKRMT